MSRGGTPREDGSSDDREGDDPGGRKRVTREKEEDNMFGGYSWQFPRRRRLVKNFCIVKRNTGDVWRERLGVLAFGTWLEHIFLGSYVASSPLMRWGG